MTIMGKVAKVLSAAPIGFEGSLIEVESDIKNGLPSLQIVGMGNKAIDEARERVRSATVNSLLDFPAKKIIVNLAPAELPKDGTQYDLPIALSVLVCSGQLRPDEVKDALFAGELALDGSLRPIRGSISIAEIAKRHNISTIYIPTQNAQQAALVDGVTIYGVTSIKELFLHLKGEMRQMPTVAKPTQAQSHQNVAVLDDILGQEQAKRALTIAAAGRHNILFTGSPGAGKTMLARTLRSLLPLPTREEQIAITKLHSLVGEAVDHIIIDRPFRSPHHTSSRVALIGGGSRPIPGEISLAHQGILFLDEIPEYARSTLEALRQPLEDRTVSISRAASRVEYPANFMLVATMNPCPCGYYGDSSRECTCSSHQILAYQKRLSGPLLDRIDMTITVPRVAVNELLHHKSSSKDQHLVAQNIIQSAHALQFKRYKSGQKNNAQLSSREVSTLLSISDDAKKLADQAAEKLHLSARSYFKLIKVSQTIADMDGAISIQPNHIAEALQYRMATP